jgi:hypothetical protein
MTGGTIFISYRREDTSGYAGRLFDRLSAHFGAARIFMDIDTIKPGVDFVTVIDNAVASCAVLLALIGHDWLSITDRSGKRRLEDPHDFNRLEIESGLKEATTVIPVLVQGTPMPAAEQLPGSMAEFARRNAIELSDARWDYDVQRLISAIEEIVGKPAPAPETRRRKLLPWLLASAVLVAAVIVAVVVLQGGPPACGGVANGTTGSLANTDIAFVSDRDNNREIYGAKAGGFGINRLTNDPLDDLRPDWSPHGNQLVFGEGSGLHAICIMNADRSQPRLLRPTSGDEQAPDWSPDGSQIVFRSGSDSQSNIFVMNADGSHVRNLTKDSNVNSSPDWSSHNKIAFSSDADGNFDIFVMGPDGTGPQRLTHGPTSDGAPAWSPKANKIAFPRKSQGQSHIFVMNADGTHPTQMTFGAVVDTAPTWSPTGGAIAFARQDSTGKHAIFVLHLGSNSLQKLGLGAGNNFDPAWRP